MDRRRETPLTTQSPAAARRPQRVAMMIRTPPQHEPAAETAKPASILSASTWHRKPQMVTPVRLSACCIAGRAVSSPGRWFRDGAGLRSTASDRSLSRTSGLAAATAAKPNARSGLRPRAEAEHHQQPQDLQQGEPACHGTASPGTGRPVGIQAHCRSVPPSFSDPDADTVEYHHHGCGRPWSHRPAAG